MSDDKPKSAKLMGGQTIQLDAVSPDLLLSEAGVSDEDEGYPEGEGALSSLPPPLPPSKAPPPAGASLPPGAMSSAPPENKPKTVLYVVGVLVAVVATALGIWVGTSMTEEEPAPTMQIDIGDIDVEAH